MITARQQKLLSAILREYVDTAEAVSSGHLADQTGMEISPATIRNELAALTETGYLTQPHTSAGRVPTEKAWRWYVQNLLKAQEVSKDTREHVLHVIHAHRHVHAELMRHLAKTLAELAQESVVLAPAPNETYYTGLSNLFAQPEFAEVNMVQAMSRVIDSFDEIVRKMYDHLENDVEVLVGRDSPFGHDCGVVIVKYQFPHQPHGLIGILGPLRQDYNEHVAMLKFTAEELNRMTNDKSDHD
jgi:transcriptional regulator of heat shock response